MSLKGDVFKAIGDRLITQIPALKWYDKDFGQAQLLQDGIISLPLPAVLITINVPEWSSILGGGQNGNASIRIRVLNENYADSFQTPDGDSINQEAALAFFEFEELIQTQLQGFYGNGFTPLNRVADNEDDDHTNVIVTDMMYESILTDQSDIDTGTVIKENAYPVPVKVQEDQITDFTSNQYIIPK